MIQSITYIPEICPYTNDCNMECAGKLDRGPQYICDHWGYRKGCEKYNNAVKAAIDGIKRWNELIKVIPQVDRWTLEGIKCWKIHKVRSQELTPDSGQYSKEEFITEGKKLIIAGFNIAYCEENGVGYLVKCSDSYSIHHYYHYNKIIIPVDGINVGLEHIWNFVKNEEDD